ncbi:unnamed protein product [Scytosiphon promiscuus]
MDHQLAKVPTPEAVLVVVPGIPPPAAPHIAVQHTPGCCAPVGANTNAAWVRWISVAIVFAHTIALILYVVIALTSGVERTLFMFTLATYITGIVSSSIMLCATSKESYRFCSVVYACLGALDMVALYTWFHAGFDMKTNSLIRLAVPTMVGTISYFAGSIQAWKATRSWERNLTGVLGDPPILVAGGTHELCEPVHGQMA